MNKRKFPRFSSSETGKHRKLNVKHANKAQSDKKQKKQTKTGKVRGKLI